MTKLRDEFLKFQEAATAAGVDRVIVNGVVVYAKPLKTKAPTTSARITTGPSAEILMPLQVRATMEEQETDDERIRRVQTMAEAKDMLLPTNSPLTHRKPKKQEQETDDERIRRVQTMAAEKDLLLPTNSPLTHRKPRTEQKQKQTKTVPARPAPEILHPLGHRLEG
jgi:hypothetical protein